MDPILVTVIAAAIIGAGTYTIRRVRKSVCTHTRHHQELETYPDIIKRHSKEHEEITASLSLLQSSNVRQMRLQLVDIHERAMKEGFISYHRLYTFDQLYENYTAMGGNGFVPALKQDIDNLNHQNDEVPNK